MEELIRELGHFGLSEKEASVYLASLELGPSPVQDISRKGKVNRATTYVMIESLMNRGLMSSFVRGKKRYYAAETPDRLRAVLRMQRKELDQKEQEFETVFPMLAALYNAEGAKPQIRYLEGVEGVKTVRETFMRLEGEILQILSVEPESPSDELETGRDEYLRDFAAKSVPYRALLVMDGEDLSKVPVWKNLEVRAVHDDREICFRPCTRKSRCGGTRCASIRTRPRFSLSCLRARKSPTESARCLNLPGREARGFRAEKVKMKKRLRQSACRWP